MTLPHDYSSRVATPLTLDKGAGKPAGDGAPHQEAKPMIFATPSSPSQVSSYPDSRSDHRWVLAAQSGCKEAFDELWNLYSRRIYRTVLNITKNTYDAEDAMQDSFLRAFLAFDNFEGRASFYSWLTRIAINSALAILRKRRSHPETSLDPAANQEDNAAPAEFRDSAPDPEQTYDQLQRRTKLMKAIHKLPANLREAVQARVTEECSLREVADRLNISEAAAKSRLYRARTRLGMSTAARYRSRSQSGVSRLPDALSA